MIDNDGNARHSVIPINQYDFGEVNARYFTAVDTLCGEIIRGMLRRAQKLTRKSMSDGDGGRSMKPNTNIESTGNGKVNNRRNSFHRQILLRKFTYRDTFRIILPYTRPE